MICDCRPILLAARNLSCRARQGGGTGWLTTTSPVVPGETATLRFVIFDEGDHILDSTVLIDNFQWQLTAADAPMTIQ